MLAHEIELDPSPRGVGNFILLFALLWRIWYDMHLWINITASEDILHRLYLLWEMILTIGMASSCDKAFESTGPMLAIFYFISRCSRALMYLLMGANDVRFLTQVVWSVTFTIFASLFMFASIFVPVGSGLQYALWWITVSLGKSNLETNLLCHSIDLIFSFSIVHILRRLPVKTRFFLFRRPKYLTALNIEHMSERMGLFIIIVLGEGVAAILFSRTDVALDFRYAKAVFGLLLGYSLHWIYFLVDGSRLFLHAVRRHILSAQMW